MKINLVIVIAISLILYLNAIDTRAQLIFDTVTNKTAGQNFAIGVPANEEIRDIITLNQSESVDEIKTTIDFPETPLQRLFK
ncbi:MAG: hypothetical protein ACRD8W_10915 [Nitrososphaeraceae archaeon]